jgi:hypothetical protein
MRSLCATASASRSPSTPGADERHLRVLLAEWLAGHQVEPSTRASYGLVIDKFILPALGGPAGDAAAVSRSRMPKQVVQMITKPPEIP